MLVIDLVNLLPALYALFVKIFQDLLNSFPQVLTDFALSFKIFLCIVGKML